MEWTVSTVVVDAAGKQTVARTIDYPLGEWEEKFDGGSALFGTTAGTVKRTTVWEAQPKSTSGVRARARHRVPREGVGRSEAGVEMISQKLNRALLVVHQAFSRHQPSQFGLFADWIPSIPM
jgi:hypothetical protein